MTSQVETIRLAAIVDAPFAFVAIAHWIVTTDVDGSLVVTTIALTIGLVSYALLHRTSGLVTGAGQ